MKKISENTKVTLTLKQLRKLVEESSKFNMVKAIERVKSDKDFRKQLVKMLLHDLPGGEGMMVDGDDGYGYFTVMSLGNVQFDRLTRAIRRVFPKHGVWILLNRAFDEVKMDFVNTGSTVLQISGPDAEVTEEPIDYDISNQETEPRYVAERRRR